MSEIRRLRDETRSGFVHALLVSTDADRPERGACDRALAALGAGAAGAAAASSAAKAATLGGSPTAGTAGGGALSVAPTAAKGGALLFAKWTGVALLSGAAAVGTVPYALHTATHVASSAPTDVVADRSGGFRSTSSSLPASRPALVESRSHSPGDAPVVAITTTVAAAPGALAVTAAPGATAVAAAPGALAVTGAASSFAAPQAVIPGVRNVRGDFAPGSPAYGNVTPRALPWSGDGPLATGAISVAPVADAVASQLAALSAVRAALAGGDPQRALALLSEFERRNRSSPLNEEATVLRVDALVDAGRGAEATALAETFLNAHPASVYSERVRSKVKSP